jgi:PTH1 family peptidyl-tRNA hydrolase
MTQTAPLRLIVGLGNPGAEYQQTRHNAGVWFIDALLKRFSATSPLSKETKFKALIGQTLIAHHTVRLLVPETFMNNSGEAIAAFSHFYKIEPASILIAHDELDLAPGNARLKFSGGHGGHNGLRSTISHLGNTKDFGRLRIGIGHPGSAKQVSNFVLSKAPANELSLIESAIDAAVNELEHIANGDWQLAMNTLHSFHAQET